MQLHISSTFFILIFVFVDANRKATRNVEITAEQEKLRDPEGFAAIRELHRLMDDDQSGSIDRFESADFLTEDLNLGGSDRARREKAFHHNNDESITVDDLWEAWFQSEERDWTNKEVIEWLKNAVKLPQYERNFETSKVYGIALPRMALQNSSYITNVLGIKNFVHRQKLQLKALDVVLFGFQDTSSRVKDIALAALLVLLITILIVFKTHKNRSKRQMEEMSTRLSELMNMETDFEGAQQRLEEDRQRRHSLIESEHIEALKNQLMEAERRIEMNGYDSIPFTLQPLLRRTYEMESAYINSQKLECLNEMREAKDFVDKIRRKQTGLMASFKIATGTGSTTDDIDTRIFTLKARMEKIKVAMDECVNRWMEIESLCGFSITGPFGVTTAANATTSAQMMASNGDAQSAYLAQQMITKGPIGATTATSNPCSGKSTPPSALTAKFSTVTTAVPSSGASVYDEYNSVRDFAQLNAHQYQPQQVGPVDDWVLNSPPSETIAGRNDTHIGYNATSPALPKYSLQHNPMHNNTSTDDTQSLSSSNSKTVSSKKSGKFTQLIRRKLNKS